MDDEVRTSVLEAITSLERLGASIKDVKWPSFHQGIEVAHLLSIAEGSTAHADRIRGLNTAEAVRLLKDLPRIEGGLMVSAHDYLLVQRVRRQFIEESHNLMENVDLLAGPTVPCVAFPLGAKEIKVKDRTVKPADIVAAYTRPFNFNGFPAITVPCGFSKTGLPIGLELTGRPYEDSLVLSVANTYEQAHSWHNKCPPI